MLDYTLKIALVPIRRHIIGKRVGIFSQAVAKEVKDDVVPYIKANFASAKVSFVDIEDFNEEGLFYDVMDSERLAARLKAAAVDAVFLINCNFGSEEAAGRLARLVGKPVLMWAVRDTRIDPDGMRYTDAQCGSFSLSRILQRLGIPFSYIENCHVRSTTFAEGLRRFFSVACMLKNFFGMRILQIGSRPVPFKSVMYNESELMEKFGIDIATVNYAIFVKEYNKVLAEKDFTADLTQLKATFDTGTYTDEALVKMLAFKDTYRNLAQEYNCRIVVTECWTAAPLALGANCCTAMSLLADEKLIVTCETDLLGGITMALLSCAALGEKLPFFGEFTARHPSNDNAELLWHCGPFAPSLGKGNNKIFNEKPSFTVKDGEYTIARLDGDRGQYSLLGGKFRTTDGPYTFGTYLWAEFDDYKKWEERLIDGPYIHHMAEIEGDYRAALKDFCRFVPGLKPDQP